MEGVHVLEHNGYEIRVMHFPYRKKPGLGLTIPGEENGVYKVASFNSEEAADWFLAHMEKMFGKAEE